MSNPKLRSGQVVTTFGPGAMVDLPDDSVLVAGLDHWKYDLSRVPKIEEPRLVAKLQNALGREQLTLRAPPPATDRDFGLQPGITAFRFPEWFIVQQARVTRQGHRRRRLVHLNALTNAKFKDEDGKPQPVVPVRFVRACKRGHVGDIDWREFVHGERSDCPRDLALEERGTSGDLDEVWVTCACGKERVMSQAARRDLRALGSCNGARPWLGPGTREACGDENRLLIRSASNAYFPQIMSVISIPDTRRPVDDAVRSLWEDFLSDVQSAEDLAKVRKKPTPGQRLAAFDDPEVLEAIERVKGNADETARKVKEVEFAALIEAKEEIGLDTPDGDFFARALPRKAWDAPCMAAVSRVVLVHRLREVRAQVGFTRFEAAGPDIQGELTLDVETAPLGLDATWLPATENRGEGVFLQFDADRVRAWQARPQVRERGVALAQGFSLWRGEHKESKREFAGLPYYMLHSFSHLLMTAISLECGYPASSLRERIFALPDDNGYGVLIYTASSDAEGTLGGLVEAGRSIRRHVRHALELGRLCSNDPVCGYHKPAKHDHQPLLGSACHGCLLISETSCEQRNDFLDRSLVVRTVEATGTEFFTEGGA